MRVREVFECSTPVSPIPGTSKKLVDDTVLLGVEVETENCGIGDVSLNKRLRFWNVKVDGSLKSSHPYEFVFRSPIQGATVEAALEELNDCLEGTSVVYPHNTSVHVHVDVSNLTTEELRSFVYLSISLESALIKISGNRRDNVFCMPHGGSNGALTRSLGLVVNGTSSDSHSPHDWQHLGKYSTVNFGTVPTLGTVEFRTHFGTHDKETLMSWINILLMLRKFAVESAASGRADELLNYCTSTKDLVEYMRQVWPSHVVRRMLHPSLHKEVMESSFMSLLSLFPKDNEEFMCWVNEEVYDPKQNTKRKGHSAKLHFNVPDWAVPQISTHSTTSIYGSQNTTVVAAPPPAHQLLDEDFPEDDED